MRTRCFVVGLAFVIGCKSDSSAPHGSGSGSGSGSASTPAPNVTTIALEIFVNDTSVAKLTPRQLAAWPRLDTLVPVSARRLGTWQTVYLKGNAAKPSEVSHPSESYPELVPAVFPKDGGAAFGMFDAVELAKRGKAVLSENVREIRIVIAQGTGRGEHESGEGGGSDPLQLKIKVKTAKGESVLEGAKLLALERTPAPGETEAKGWPLTTVLDAAGVKKFERLLLTDAAGMNLTLDKADFDAKTSVPYIKLNRQGALRFRVFKKQGETWQPSSDLRGLVAIEVVK